MIKFIKRNFKMCIALLPLIVITALAVYGTYFYNPTMVIELERDHFDNWIDFKTGDGVLERGLQGQSQSFLENTKFLYTYGSTGFVYVNLENGHIYVVPRDPSLTRERMLRYSTKDENKKRGDFPHITILSEEQLEPGIYEIMKVLKNTKVTNPRYYTIQIFSQ